MLVRHGQAQTSWIDTAWCAQAAKVAMICPIACETRSWLCKRESDCASGYVLRFTRSFACSRPPRKTFSTSRRWLPVELYRETRRKTLIVVRPLLNYAKWSLISWPKSERTGTRGCCNNERYRQRLRLRFMANTTPEERALMNLVVWISKFSWTLHTVFGDEIVEWCTHIKHGF